MTEKPQIKEERQLQNKIESLCCDLQPVPMSEIIKSLRGLDDTYAHTVADKLQGICAVQPEGVPYGRENDAWLKQLFDEAEDKQRTYMTLDKATVWVGLTAGGGH